MRRRRLIVILLVLGLLGSSSIMAFQFWASTRSWPINVGGQTIHRWAGVFIGPENDETDVQAARRIFRAHRHPQDVVDRLNRCQTLIIDEISMLTGRMVDFLDYWFRTHRNSTEPWGGMQVILCGDVLQLPPVRKNHRLPYDWAFHSKLWRKGQAVHEVIVLNTVRRQDEKPFVKALMAVRKGQLDQEDVDLLAHRVQGNAEEEAPRIFTHNSMVDKWCNFMLDELPGEPRVYLGKGDGMEQQVTALKGSILAPEMLILPVPAPKEAKS